MSIPEDDLPEPSSERTSVDAAALPPERTADNGDFPQSKTLIERLPMRAETKAAVESWSNDMPPADPPSEAHSEPTEHSAAVPEPPLEDSAPIPVVETPRRPKRASFADDGWGGGRDFTGQETAGHSRPQSVDADATGSLDHKLAERASAEAKADTNEAPRLVCIDGPDKGKEFVLTGRDVSVGRGPENDVVINDTAMSRVHCRILIGADQVIVTDQRSANGTLVNGRKIDRATIVSGATMKLGGSLFRFIEMGDVIKSTEIHHTESGSASVSVPGLAAPASHRDRRLAFGIIAAAGVVAVVIVLSSVWNSVSQRQPAQKPDDMAESAFSAGVVALQAKQVDEALRRFRQAQEAKPDKRYQDHIALADKERANLAAIAAAEQAADKSQLAAMQTAMTLISSDTIYISDVTSLRVRSMQLRDQREHDAEILLAKKKWTSADEEAALAVEAELRAVEPPSPRLQELSAHALVTKKTAHNEGRPVIERVETPVHAEPRGGGELESKALRQFTNGDMDSALSTLGGGSLPEGAMSLKNKLLKFQEVYGQAKTQAQAKQGSAAASIRKALAFELKIANGGSRYAQELKALQADADVDAASQALNDQKFAEAYHLLKEATTLSPGHPVASRKLAEMSGRARDMFNQGYILKDSDLKQAREKWKAVMAMVPPEDEAYQKAKKWTEQTK